MWIFTSQGFISAVAHREQPDYLLVRARRREHLAAIFPSYAVSQTERADYRYRIQVHREDFAQAIADEARAIAYDNFKNSIADHAYHDACSGVWSVMHRLQPGSYYQGVTLAHEHADPWGGEAEEDPGWDSLIDATPLQRAVAAEQGAEIGICEACGCEFIQRIEGIDQEARTCTDCTPPPP